MRRRPGRFPVDLALAATVLLLGTLPVAAQVVVQRVSVQVTVDGPLPHPLVQDRLRATVLSVSERLLVGRAVDQLAPLTAQLGETLAGVVDRVAAGYAVTAVSLRLGAEPDVSVRLRPVGPVVAEVSVTPDLRMVPERLRPLAGGLLQERVAPPLRSLYGGLPEAALLWAGPVLERRAQEAVEEALPGYSATVRVEIRGATGEVAVTVMPRDTRVIRNLGVRFRSTSIPTLLLDQHRPAVISMAEFLRGVPVTFAQAHAGPLADLLRSDLAAYPPALRYGIAAVPVLDVGETTYVNVVAESRRYRGRAEAHLNVGTRAPGPQLLGRLGVLVHPQTETFAEIRLAPQTLSLEWSLGAELAVLPTVRIGAAYGLVAQEVRTWAQLQVGFDTALRGTWFAGQQAFEGAFIYRINEFLSGELVGTSRGEWWVRLVSNL